mmetsp:Transcript_7969/g.8985  ORF Transcript_7969/g.8985 Transcript_7969/m.8985 type:complete len:266 (+) Transcript_7969:126-923(+)|eukprot:CAMPEP_0176447572 /NCGR_PEP_ID=MMETSP0127-20121128/25136_1 /TAXON_ID=938130 /ORGANISM="Platyophrya macrostoma, Strain WH" /LENGTH=265 /DNA_ID=CAMNT_0017834093 /DNA_START=126 /DNA_END=923 /DNA_ORIENTATION=-
MPFDEASYIFPSHKLRLPLSPSSGRRPVVLVSCGSLNPVHVAHLDMLRAAKTTLEASGRYAVMGSFLSPVNDAYGKPGLASFEARLEACRIAVADDPCIEVDDWEGRQDAYVRTYFVLEHMRTAVAAWLRDMKADVATQDVAVCLVCGGDLFETFYRPDCWNLKLLRKILDNFEIAVATREGSLDPRAVIAAHAAPLTNRSEPGESLDMAPYASKIIVFDMPPNATSSTAIRGMLSRGHDVPVSMMRIEVASYLRASKTYSFLAR